MKKGKLSVTVYFLFFCMHCRPMILSTLSVHIHTLGRNLDGRKHVSSLACINFFFITKFTQAIMYS